MAKLRYASISPTWTTRPMVDQNSEQSTKIPHSPGYSFRWGIPLLDRGHTSAPNFFFDHYAEVGVTKIEFLTILHLARYRFERAGSECRPAVRTVSRQMGIGNRRLQQIIAGLEKRGLLERHYRSGRTTIYDFSGFSRAVLEVAQSNHERDFRGEESFGGGVKVAAPEKNRTIDNTNNEVDDPSSDQSTIKSLLTDFGIDSVVATRLARNCSVEFVHAWIDHTQRISHGLKSPQAFLVSRLKLGEPPPSQSTNTGESVQGRRRTRQGGSSRTCQGNCGRTLPRGYVCPNYGKYPECRGCEGADSEESPQDDGSFQETPLDEDPDATNAQREKARQMITHLENNLSADRPTHREAVPPC
jgi:hypothetical protein